MRPYCQKQGDCVGCGKTRWLNREQGTHCNACYTGAKHAVSRQEREERVKQLGAMCQHCHSHRSYSEFAKHNVSGRARLNHHCIHCRIRYLQSRGKLWPCHLKAYQHEVTSVPEPLPTPKATMTRESLFKFYVMSGWKLDRNGKALTVTMPSGDVQRFDTVTKWIEWLDIRHMPT